MINIEYYLSVIRTRNDISQDSVNIEMVCVYPTIKSVNCKVSFEDFYVNEINDLREDIFLDFEDTKVNNEIREVF